MSILIRPKHTCTRKYKNHVINSKWIADKCIEQFRSQLNIHEGDSNQVCSLGSFSQHTILHKHLEKHIDDLSIRAIPRDLTPSSTFTLSLCFVGCRHSVSTKLENCTINVVSSMRTFPTMRLNQP